MPRPRKRVNRFKKTRRSPLIPLLILGMMVAAGIFLLLDKTKTPEPQPKQAQPEVRRHRMPPRGPAQMQASSAVSRPPATPAAKKTAGAPRVAIIIDDMGSSVSEANALMAIGVPLSFAVIPGLPKMREVAEAAHGRGYQVLVHMPMEPQEYPQRRLEANGLLLSHGDAETLERARSYFRAVPYAVGANNHMGSRFTEHENKMRLVIGLLKERGDFFVDSKTSPRSVGLAVARSMGVRCASRDTFLDNDYQDVAAIGRQLQILADTARRRGSAIGICHPHKETIQALAIGLPVLKREGIKFVPVSELVR